MIYPVVPFPMILSDT